MVMEHMDEQPVHEYQLEVAATGAYMEFDTWGSEFYYGPHTPYRRSGTSSVPKSVKTLIDHGHVGQLLMAQDVWLR